MNRDMIAIAEATRKKIPLPYALTVGDLQQLYDMYKAGKLYEAFGTAFRYGYAMGQRAIKRNAQRKRQASKSKQATAKKKT